MAVNLMTDRRRPLQSATGFGRRPDAMLLTRRRRRSVTQRDGGQHSFSSKDAMTIQANQPMSVGCADMAAAAKKTHKRYPPHANTDFA